MKPLDVARVILAGTAATYILSAVLLGVARAKGQPVPAWVVGGWLVTGALGLLGAWQLAPRRTAMWFGLIVAMMPWMAYALFGDLRERHWVIAAVDLAGLLAIAYALAVAKDPVFG